MATPQSSSAFYLPGKSRLALVVPRLPMRRGTRNVSVHSARGAALTGGSLVGRVCSNSTICCQTRLAPSESPPTSRGPSTRRALQYLSAHPRPPQYLCAFGDGRRVATPPLHGQTRFYQGTTAINIQSVLVTVTVPSVVFYLAKNQLQCYQAYRLTAVVLHLHSRVLRAVALYY